MGIYGTIILMSFLWDTLVRPFKSKLDFLNSVLSHVSLLSILFIYFEMCKEKVILEEELKVYGDYAIFIIATISILKCLITLCRNTHDLYQNYRRIKPIASQESYIQSEEKKIPKIMELTDHTLTHEQIDLSKSMNFN